MSLEYNGAIAVLKEEKVIKLDLDVVSNDYDNISIKQDIPEDADTQTYLHTLNNLPNDVIKEW